MLGGHYGYEPSPAAPLAGMANAALANLVRSLADHWGPQGVTVHLVAPGPVESPRMHGDRRAHGRTPTAASPPSDVLDEYRAGSPLGPPDHDRRGGVGGRRCCSHPRPPRCTASTLVARPRPTARDRLGDRDAVPPRRPGGARRIPSSSAELLRRTAELFAEITESPIDRIRTQVHELPADSFAVGGVPIAESGVQAPFITLDLLEGRPIEQHTALIERMSSAGGRTRRRPARSCPAADQRSQATGWGIGGVPASELRQQEIASRRDDH